MRGPPAFTFEPTPQTCKCSTVEVKRSAQSSLPSDSASGSQPRTRSDAGSLRDAELGVRIAKRRPRTSLDRRARDLILAGALRLVERGVRRADEGVRTRVRRELR